MHREYHKWFSNNLQRDMELLVFGHSGRAVLFFPTRMARFYDYENWGIVDALKSLIENGELQLFCLDSIDAESFYNDDVFPSVRIDRHLQYEKYVLDEVLPLIYLKNNGGYIETAGCSMGAYHAINLAMKYPWLFRKAVGISGRYDLTDAPGDFKDLMNGFRNEVVYLNMPAQFITNLSDNHLINHLRQMEIILAVGETDPFLGANQYLSQTLWNKGIQNQFHTWESNAHRPHYWRKMVPLYI
ncbi:esterase family protein [Pedobacter rhodius]|uniref:Alpha/beta hydrolase-fold protein n=1 Tax=Pedobacter rhodius TaxID=3004098 RepID=A0ABT4KUG8_9SPHI|nr:alpha/beta hydrolase-fold protein [Pedobacter sp. SJ11]MCZ4222566.1 alpha/beta hydrolase-fold protein [Pedobacter sp. SJ11]